MSYLKAKNAPNSTSAGAPPQTPLGELTALPQTPQLDLRGPTSKGGEGKGGQEGRGGKGEIGGGGKGRRGGQGRGRDGRGKEEGWRERGKGRERGREGGKGWPATPFANFWIRPCQVYIVCDMWNIFMSLRDAAGQCFLFQGTTRDGRVMKMKNSARSLETAQKETTFMVIIISVCIMFISYIFVHQVASQLAVSFLWQPATRCFQFTMRVLTVQCGFNKPLTLSRCFCGCCTGCFTLLLFVRLCRDAKGIYLLKGEGKRFLHGDLICSYTQHESDISDIYVNSLCTT